MNEAQFDTAFGNYELEEAYAEYIMANSANDVVVIHNGDTLTCAMEDGYLLEEFKQSVIGLVERRGME